MEISPSSYVALYHFLVTLSTSKMAQNTAVPMRSEHLPPLNPCILSRKPQIWQNSVKSPGDVLVLVNSAPAVMYTFSKVLTSSTGMTWAC